MCGIFAAIESKKERGFLESHFEKIKHRGPDNSTYVNVDDHVQLGFHRLAINGQTDISNQPFFIDGVWLIANAEVFNHVELESRYGFSMQTESDCEVIIHMYKAFGIERTLKELVAEFAFLLYDTIEDEIIIARDHLGVRGLYVGTDDQGGRYIASEAKAISFCDDLMQFPPRHYWSSKTLSYTAYYDLDFAMHSDQREETHLAQINRLFTKAVKDRMMSDRKIGCLLSGGLDSSLVSAIVARAAEDPRDIETFSIGLEGSPDLIAAQKVADHIGTTHHSVVFTEDQFIGALRDTVYITGSFDVTTIRASVGHQLISNWIKENSDVKVLFTGETIDEMGSYLYFQQAPDPESFQDEAIRLLEDIHYFDMLRGDRSISSAGLEARVPFADKEFVEYFMGIKPEQRMFDGTQRIEKYLVRKAFAHEDLLPDEILWRRKNGFSDSVSDKKKSWSAIIQEYVDRIISDEEFNTEKQRFTHNEPKIKEAYFYRKVFESFYGQFDLSTPYQWLPKWCGEVSDPSARVLEIYQAD
jgi:asparagine synthase (glutamine-hydrolysing)